MMALYFRIFILLVVMGSACFCHAFDLKVKVLTVDNKPLNDAVVYIESFPEAPVSVGRLGVMDQQDKAFVPHVLAVPVGTTVDFPNTDSVNHYVYSFSDIKKFQFKLFKGDVEKHQIQFDKPGLITLGCNIHDFMLGYIFVAPTPYAGVTDSAGIVNLKLPDKGEFTLAIWHERSNENLDKLVQKINPENAPKEIQLKFLKTLKPQRKMSHEGDDY